MSKNDIVIFFMTLIMGFCISIVLSISNNQKIEDILLFTNLAIHDPYTNEVVLCDHDVKEMFNLKYQVINCELE